jgi:glycosyltransferase involved in cell wall biosynthesis
MWRYRQQLAKHLASFGMLADYKRVLPVRFTSPVLQVLANEITEPLDRCISWPAVSIFPFNTLPEFCPKLGGLVVLVVCDLMFLNKAATHTWGARYRRTKFHRALRRANAVLTISHTVAGELRDMVTSAQPVFVLPVSLDDVFTQPTSLRKGRGGAFQVLHLGGTYESKATELVVAAAAMLAANGMRIHLFIAAMAKHGEYVRRLAEQRGLAASCYTVLPRLSDSEMREMYGTVDLHCMPSRGEGFGIPILEAASQGTPNLLSPLPVFREILGDNALYATDWSPQSLARGIERAMESDLTVVVDAARRRSEEFSFRSIHERYAVPVSEFLFSRAPRVAPARKGTAA